MGKDEDMWSRMSTLERKVAKLEGDLSLMSIAVFFLVLNVFCKWI